MVDITRLMETAQNVKYASNGTATIINLGQFDPACAGYYALVRQWEHKVHAVGLWPELEAKFLALPQFTPCVRQSKHDTITNNTNEIAALLGL